MQNGQERPEPGFGIVHSQSVDLHVRQDLADRSCDPERQGTGIENLFGGEMRLRLRNIRQPLLEATTNEPSWRKPVGIPR